MSSRGEIFYRIFSFFFFQIGIKKLLTLNSNTVELDFEKRLFKLFEFNWYFECKKETDATDGSNFNLFYLLMYSVRFLRIYLKGLISCSNFIFYKLLIVLVCLLLVTLRFGFQWKFIKCDLVHSNATAFKRTKSKNLLVISTVYTLQYYEINMTV